ncbi:Phosphoribosylformylglycinamidine synthase [Operophtera brumata]|uniref:Phosphoribosylformylglycinamidine synthase n=1 Tax=Operophtera brumata TaxID=104452 RepID=A0A0L7LN97_OPEBR|nr:Phosphoribosylformylglycinamidine synthase [Operophtera brumata]
MRAYQRILSHGLAFDSWDMDFYMDLFVNKLKRDPTSVELFDLAQSNSEHSRHWFFKGKIILDGKEIDESLIDMVASTQNSSNKNNVIKFGDNSSNVRDPSLIVEEETESDIIFTAETHNMPTAVAPFSGATTGTGGRIRDVQGVGRGGYTVAGTAGYSVGNLHIPDAHNDYGSCAVQWNNNRHGEDRGHAVSEEGRVYGY